MARDTFAGDTLVYPGGSVKALDDDGTFEGLLIPFGQPDLSSFRDVFTRDTELWLDDDGTRKCVVLYDHGLDPDLGPLWLGAGEMKTVDAGVWMKGQIKLRDQYLKKYGQHADAIKAEAKAGRLGLSSGALAHLVRREAQPDGTHKVLSWMVGEASLTARPAAPQAQTFAVKSLAELKGEFLEDAKGEGAATKAMDRVNDLLTRLHRIT